MEDEIKDLKLEIEVLKKRVAALEAKERNRKIVKIIKTMIVIVLIILVVIYGYKLYQLIMNYYEEINGILENPLKSIL